MSLLILIDITIKEIPEFSQYIWLIMWNISWYFKLFKESSSSYCFCSSLNWISFNYQPNWQVGELMHEALCKDYCMKLFTVHEIEHVKLLLLQKVICVCLFPIPCILLSEVFVPILPLWSSHTRVKVEAILLAKSRQNGFCAQLQATLWAKLLLLGVTGKPEVPRTQ